MKYLLVKNWAKTAFVSVLLFSIPSISLAGVFAHYSFDTDYSDSSGNARHGALTDVGTIGNTTITSTTGEFKFGGGAVDFSDDRDYVALASKTFSSGVPYSISFWAQVDSASRQWNMAIGQRGASSFFIAPNGSANNLTWRSSNSTAARQADFATGVDDTAWHHYVITADNSGNVSC